MPNKLFKREKYLNRIRGFYNDFELIKVLTGIRRCGKSSLMQLIIDELIESNVKEENIIYLNLDKRPYMNIRTSNQLDELIESKLNNLDGYKYLFIDEIQNVKDFEIIINSYREEGNISIFITGSNSYLLSGELITKLTGRYLEFKIEPLTFKEYLEMKQFYHKEIIANLDEELTNYIIYGGFPHTVLLDREEDKQVYINGLIEEILNKDIKRNNKIRDKHLFNQIMKYIINNFGAKTSINSICDNLEKINGTRPSRKTVYSYLNILENAKIINKCERFDLKSKKSVKGEEKYYLTDLSIYYAMNNDQRINYGPVLENLIFNYAKYQGYSLSIGKIGKLEIDFIVRNNREYAYLQIAMTIHGEEKNEYGIPLVEEREYRPLEIIKDNYPKYVLTLDSLLQQRSGIKNKNIIKLMLNDEIFS